MYTWNNLANHIRDMPSADRGKVFYGLMEDDEGTICEIEAKELRTEGHGEYVLPLYKACGLICAAENLKDYFARCNASRSSK